MLTAYKPEFDELWFRRLMLSDPETMSYNHASGGTIPFPEERWGEWYERMKNFNDYEELQYNIRECHEYLPIPDKQVKYSGYALDNKEYNKYGM